LAPWGCIAPLEPIDGDLAKRLIGAHIAVPAQQGGQIGVEALVGHGRNLCQPAGICSKALREQRPTLTRRAASTYRTSHRLVGECR